MSAMSSCSAFMPSKNQQGDRLTTLHSGAKVETLAAAGEFTQVRLSDGTIRMGQDDISHDARTGGGACQRARRGAGPQPRGTRRRLPRRQPAARWSACSANSRQNSRSWMPHGSLAPSGGSAGRSAEVECRDRHRQSRGLRDARRSCVRLLAGIRNLGASGQTEVRRHPRLLGESRIPRADPRAVRVVDAADL